jgi:hypothetical protein
MVVTLLDMISDDYNYKCAPDTVWALMSGESGWEKRQRAVVLLGTNPADQRRAPRPDPDDDADAAADTDVCARGAAADGAVRDQPYAHPGVGERRTA